MWVHWKDLHWVECWGENWVALRGKQMAWKMAASKAEKMAEQMAVSMAA
jgi:hypothetical protein